MNSNESKTSTSKWLLHNLSEKIHLKRNEKYVALSNISIYYSWKKKKSHSQTKNLKYQLRRGLKNLSFLMNHILHKIFKIILNISYKNIKKRLTILQ